MKNVHLVHLARISNFGSAEKAEKKTTFCSGNFLGALEFLKHFFVTLISIFICFLLHYRNLRTLDIEKEKLRIFLFLASVH